MGLPCWCWRLLPKPSLAVSTTTDSTAVSTAMDCTTTVSATVLSDTDTATALLLKLARLTVPLTPTLLTLPSWALPVTLPASTALKTSWVRPLTATLIPDKPPPTSRTLTVTRLAATLTSTPKARKSASATLPMPTDSGVVPVVAAHTVQDTPEVAQAKREHAAAFAKALAQAQ